MATSHLALRGGQLRFICVALAIFPSCGARSAPPRTAAPQIAAVGVTEPEGAALAEACTPSGPELCFNATDDNCNGIIDEGCGEETGLLQFTIAWGASAADVNLTVVIPSHERVPNDRTRATASGFQFGRDCPGADGCGGQNVENVYFDGLEPPRGHYAVEVTLVDLHGADAPVKVRLGARIGGKVLGFDLELAPGDAAKKTFAFDLP